MRSYGTLRSFALLEMTKGASFLLVGIGFFFMVHRDTRNVAGWMFVHANLNPDAPYPRHLLDVARHLTDLRLQLLGIGATSYAFVLLVEAYGLWHARRWAEWLAAMSGAVYIPIEIIAMHERFTWLGFGALALNLAMVAYMLRRVSQQDCRLLKQTHFVSRLSWARNQANHQ